MNFFSRLAGVLILGSGPAIGAQADVPPYGSDAPVYSRTYSARHLRFYPNQRVKKITVANELYDSVQSSSPFMRSYQDAALVGEIELRGGTRLAVNWMCRADAQMNGGVLQCIPNEEELWEAMFYSVIDVKVDSYDPYSSVLPLQETMTFPGTVAFRAIEGSGQLSKTIVRLGADQSGPHGDTLFRLKLVRTN